MPHSVQVDSLWIAALSMGNDKCPKLLEKSKIRLNKYLEIFQHEEIICSSMETEI